MRISIPFPSIYRCCGCHLVAGTCGVYLPFFSQEICLVQRFIPTTKITWGGGGKGMQKWNMYIHIYIYITFKILTCKSWDGFWKKEKEKIELSERKKETGKHRVWERQLPLSFFFLVMPHGKCPTPSTRSRPCLTHHHCGGRVGGEGFSKLLWNKKSFIE